MNKLIKTIRYRIRFKIWFTIHTLPENLIELWQKRLLRKLILYSYVNVPMYKKLWDTQGVNVLNLKKISDLQSFPIISKKTFQAHYVEEYARMANPRLYGWLNTFWNSGERFSFIFRKNDPYYNDFFVHRFLFWEGYSVASIQNELSLVRIRLNPPVKNYKARLFIPTSRFLLNTRETLEKIHARRPLIISANPSILAEIANATIRFPQFKLAVKYAISGGKNLSQQRRRFIEKTLGCEVFNRYELLEFGVLGTECKYHNGFHINVESFVVEIVDQNGLNVSPGVFGRIIITDLRNYAMPFIRYDTGDTGFFIKEFCSCGLAGFKLKIHSNASNYITFGFEKTYHSEVRDILVKFFGIILQFQMKKVDDRNVTLSVVPGEGMNSFVRGQVESCVKKLLPKDCSLKIEIVESII